MRAVMRKVNTLLHESTERDKFVTAFYSVLDFKHRVLIFSNAGHNPPFLIHRDGSWSRLDAGGSVLGIDAGSEFTDEEVTLAAGDRVVLFTDGVTESTDSAGEEFGEDRLRSLAVEHCHLTAEAMHRRVLEGLLAFNSGRFEDDMTLIVLAAE
mgnify:CR=1 FL=1